MPRQTEKTNTERVQELYDSFAEGDFETIRDIMDPDVELHEPKGIAGGGTQHGFDEIVENVFSKIGTEWEVFRSFQIDTSQTVISSLSFSRGVVRLARRGSQWNTRTHTSLISKTGRSFSGHRMLIPRCSTPRARTSTTSSGAGVLERLIRERIL